MVFSGSIRLAITLEKRVGDMLVDESIENGLANLGPALQSGPP
jgi:hypothetical protein